MNRDPSSVDCPTCHPTIIDPKGQSLASDTPEMIATLSVWNQSSLAERQAYHRVTCLNSRDDADMTVFQALSERIQEAVFTVNESLTSC